MINDWKTRLDWTRWVILKQDVTITIIIIIVIMKTMEDLLSTAGPFCFVYSGWMEDGVWWGVKGQDQMKRCRFTFRDDFVKSGRKQTSPIFGCCFWSFHSYHMIFLSRQSWDCKCSNFNKLLFVFSSINTLRWSC